jgi:hypothetical protein
MSFDPFIICLYLLKVCWLSFKERPFNLKGGGYGFFIKKYSDSQCCWKKYSDFGGGKKKSDSEFLSYNIILNSGNKFCTLCCPKKDFWTKQKTGSTVNHP